MMDDRAHWAILDAAGEVATTGFGSLAIAAERVGPGETLVQHAGEIEAPAYDPGPVTAWMLVAEARAYLARTDWMVIRSIETGAAVSADVTARRQAARDLINAEGEDADAAAILFGEE